MDQAGRKSAFSVWLRRSWNTLMRAVEAMEQSPMEDLFHRIDRLEREIAALKDWKATERDSPMPARARAGRR
jgi:polyhydroxyalkanoate synthesis regulator phasin